MKIGITGSHWTWKSTILKAMDFPHKITEVSRSLIEELWFNPLVWESTYEDKLNFELKILRKQIEKEKENTHFLSDRTVFDVVAYASTLLNEKDMDIIYSLAFDHFYRNPYDLIVYTPIEFTMENDGVRPVDEEYRESIARRIHSLIHKLNETSLTEIIYVRGTVEERLEQIKKAVERVQKMRKGVWEV